MYGVFFAGPNPAGTSVTLIPARYTTNFALAVDAARGAVLSGLLRPQDKAEVTRFVSGGNTAIYRVKGDGFESFMPPVPGSPARAEGSHAGDVALTHAEMEMLTQTVVPGGAALIERAAGGIKATIEPPVTLADLAG